MSDEREPRIEHVPEVTAEMENWRDVPFFPDGSRPNMRTSRRDPVEPVPIGTYVAMVFRVVGYDRDVDGSLMARLESQYNAGRYDREPTTRFEGDGWTPTHIGLSPQGAYVLDGPDTLDRLAGDATIVPQPQSESGDEK